MTTYTWKEMLAKAAAMTVEEMTEDALLELVEGLVVDSALLAPYIQFKESGYSRNVLFRDEKFEAICLCWEPGQGTMVHSHGRSFGVVCVYEGALTIDHFKRLDDGTVDGHAELAPVSRLKVPAGGITLDRVGGIHRIFNRPDAPRRAVSLHFYAGPLDTMESFEPANKVVKIVPMQGEPMAYMEPGADVMAAMIKDPVAATYRDILEDLKETASRFAERSREPAWAAALLEPGWLALAWYRLTHWLYQHKQPVLAGLIARQVRRSTGIDLHPGARVGRRCLLLGAPLLVGETAVIGDDCLIEPGVVMHGLAAGDRRHPTLGDRVRVEAGAILVGDLFLGNDVRVSAGAVVTRDVPDGGLAVGVPGRVLPRDESRPDPDARAIQALAERLYHLEEQLQVMAFALSRSQGERWRTRQPEQYGAIREVEALIDGAGI